ncbi:MAG: zinc-dependent alcohol dehydrogenase family protein [Desulfuromonadales bacterium]
MAKSMKAMQLTKIVDLDAESEPLQLVDCLRPEAGAGQVRIRVTACGVCHTELDEIEGRTAPPCLPVIPGHQVVGAIDQVGSGVHARRVGERVGVAWIYSSCNQCLWCKTERENLCPEFQATGRDADGGYAEYIVVPEESTYLIPDAFSDIQAAPLLCAGAIGYRSLRLARLEGESPLGLTGFGASAHLALQLTRHFNPTRPVFVFARNPQEREFARELGAAWTGDTDDQAPQLMQAIIDTTPAWRPVVKALPQLEPGGRLIINAIRKLNTDRQLLAEIDYPRDLWMEKCIQSVANVSRRDVREFLQQAAEVPIQPTTETFPYHAANQALRELKAGQIRGAKVLKFDSD